MIVGLTGGIGTGKSTAAQFFKDLGITVVDADQVARDVVEPGTEALHQIATRFGDSVITNGHLDRKQLRQVIFSDSAAKTWLEQLLHPLIRKEMMSQLEAAQSPYAILEAPLLFENKLEQRCHRTILVDIPEQLQIERASSRDQTSSEEIQQIIELQMPREAKKQKADYVLDNSGTSEDLNNQILRLDQILRLLAANAEFV